MCPPWTHGRVSGVLAPSDRQLDVEISRRAGGLQQPDDCLCVSGDDAHRAGVAGNQDKGLSGLPGSRRLQKERRMLTIPRDLRCAVRFRRCMPAALLVLAYAILTPRRSPGQTVEDKNICGPLALAAVSEYLGSPELSPEAFRLLPPSGTPRNLGELQAASRQMGLCTRALRWQRYSRVDLSSPAIIPLNPKGRRGVGHFVVLLALENGRFFVLDPPKTAGWRSSDELWNEWDGVALHVAMSESSLLRYDSYCSQKSRALLAVLLGCASAVVGLPFLIRVSMRACLTSHPRRWPHRLTDWRVLASICAVTAGVGGYVASRHQRVAARGPFITAIPDARLIRLRWEELPKSGAVSTDFLVQNNTDKVAKLTRVDTSCGCARPTVSATEIPPGGRISIKVDVSPGANKVTKFKITAHFRIPTEDKIVLQGCIVCE
ncbi:MAG: DUF1573 domain-containing protein [Isosphaeraceae bacterium]